MKAIICAAGEGKRLRPYTINIPKCLLKVGNKTILEHILDNLSEARIKDVIIVVGYKKESIINKIGNKYKNCNIDYVINKDYLKTNNMYSLWLAMQNIDDEIIFFNADILFNKEILSKVLENKNNVIITSSVVKEDSMRTIIHGNIVKKLGKDIVGEVKGDAIGIYKLSKDVAKGYLKKASEIINNGELNCSFVEPINLLADKINFNAIYIKEDLWIEIDNLEDYEKARERVNKIIF